jgi:hypothetical protein
MCGVSLVAGRSGGKRYTVNAHRVTSMADTDIDARIDAMHIILTFICVQASTLSYDVAHRTVRS